MGFYNYYYYSIKAFAPFSCLFIVDEEVVSGQHLQWFLYWLLWSYWAKLDPLIWGEKEKKRKKRGGGGEEGLMCIAVGMHLTH